MMKKKGISRRDFLKGTAAGAATMAISGILGACASDTAGTTMAAESEAATTAAQTEAATAAAQTEAATVAETAAAETAAPGAASEGGDFAAQYGSNFNWLGEAPVIADSEIVETYDCDILVIGSGNSGLPCARKAAELGKKVIVMERLGEEVWAPLGCDVGTVNSQLFKDLCDGDTIDEIAVYNEWMRRTYDRSNQHFAYQFATRSGEAADYLRAVAPQDELDEYSVCYNFPRGRFYDGQNHYEVNHSGYTSFPGTVSYRDFNNKLGGGENQPAWKAILLYSVEEAKKNGAEWLWGTSAVVLCQNADGDVTGAVMEPGPRAAMNFGNGAGAPSLAAFGNYPVFGSDGKRFYNDAMLQFGGQGFFARRPAGDHLCTIMDSNWNENMARMGYEHNVSSCTCEREWNLVIESMKEGVDAYHADPAKAGPEGFDTYSFTGFGLNKGAHLFVADTLEELADYLGYEGEAKQGLLDEIAHYNEMCAAGRDTDFGRDASLMIPIEKGPFFGVSTVTNKGRVMSGMVQMSGVLVTDHNEVRRKDDSLIKGLYAVGNDCGGRYAVQYHTLMAGNSVGSAITQGYCLGEYLGNL